MQFVESSIADVKSIAQRALVLHWSRAAAGRPLPDFEDFQPPSRGHDPNLMVIWRVDESVDGPEFRALFQGDHVAVAFRQRWEGRNMAEMIPGSLRAPALDGARFCVEERLAVYMVYTTLDADGQRVDGERLLLPFGSPDGSVKQLLASMEVISVTRNVALSKALNHFERAHQIVFAGCFGPLPRGHGSLHVPRTGLVEITAT
jgi:hypothetical protein